MPSLPKPSCRPPTQSPDCDDSLFLHLGTTRKFDSDKLYSRDLTPNEIAVDATWTDQPWIFLHCPAAPPRCLDCAEFHPVVHSSEIVISVDGACSNNGLPNAVAAAGVYVGRDSRYNQSFLIEGEATNQRAELMAAIAACKQALLIRRNRIMTRGLKGSGGPVYDPLKMVVIKADSEYVVKGITEWYPKWQQNGFMTANKKPVANVALFRELDGLVTQLEDLNVKVMFWHVLRAYNKDADSLANEALRR